MLRPMFTCRCSRGTGRCLPFWGGGRVYYKSEKYFDVEALPSLWDKSVLPAKLPGNLTGVLCSRGAGEGECEVVVEIVVEAAGVFVC